MSRNVKLLIAALVVAIIVVGLAAFWAGILQARKTATVVKVTPAQMADAMQADHFFSSYGGAAVLFRGVVASSTFNNGQTTVVYKTGRPYSVVCELSGSVTVRTGQSMAVVAPAGAASRQPSGVLLHHCVQLVNL